MVCLVPANKILLAENTDFSTGITPATSCVENVCNCSNVRDKVITQIEAVSRRKRRADELLQDRVVVETKGNNQINKQETGRLFYSSLDYDFNEIKLRFCQ